MTPSKIDFKEVTTEEAAGWLADAGEPPFRARQILAWIRHRGVDDFAAMTDLAKPLRQWLAEHATVTLLTVAHRSESVDGTVKFLFRLGDGHTVESVWIPEEDRATLCVSSQVGCKLDCGFCLTGAGGFVRNLTAGEIVDQVIQVKRTVPDGRITNLVFMGMGEPLDNYDAVVRALEAITDTASPLVGARKVTLSTCGLAPAIERLAVDFPKIKLAVSLNGTTDEQRAALMPVNRAFPLRRLLEALSKWPLPQGRRITFEYVLMAGVNDSDADAERLVRLTGQVPATINLIPFNECPGLPYHRPSRQQVERFRDIVYSHHRVVTIRESRGQDILAACGQLREQAEGA
ncbi:MAG: 23S rRNA (adenine(2503)-C(2))-methyltransferase RlmN [Nitrospinae bacterium]|nr:23S rRNA (adenine(2503)-C(2))-methyltransferase RlmN [Nitrospinota bacterium]